MLESALSRRYAVRACRVESHGRDGLLGCLSECVELYVCCLRTVNMKVHAEARKLGPHVKVADFRWSSTLLLSGTKYTYGTRR